MISRETRISELFVTLADTLIDDFDVVDFLHSLADACIELLDVDAAGLMLANPRGGLRLVASAPDMMRDLEVFELQADEGPCLDTFSTGEPVVNVDLNEAKDRWPAFTAAALAADLRSTHAVPLRLRGQLIGAMNLFSSGTSSLTEADLSLGQALADVATISLLQQRAIQEQALLAQQLQTALDTRILVEQAKGVLAERSWPDPDRDVRLPARSRPGNAADHAGGGGGSHRGPPRLRPDVAVVAEAPSCPSTGSGRVLESALAFDSAQGSLPQTR